MSTIKSSSSQTDLIRKIYDEPSEDYDDSFHRLLAEEYIRIAQPREGKNTLDLACGTGLVAFLAVEKVGLQGHVFGVDISEGLDLLPPEPEGFDLITCASALVLLTDPLQAIKHWTTLLKPGGRLVNDVAVKDVHVPSRILGRIGDQLGRSLQWDQSWVQDEGSLEMLLKDAGLHVKSVFLSKTFEVHEYEAAQAPQAFECAITSPMFRSFGDASIKEEAKRLFIEIFTEETGPDGVLLNEAKIYIGVAYKS